MPTRRRVTKYEQAFRTIGVPFDGKAKLMVKCLENGGRTEGSICFAIWKEKNTLIEHRDTKEFWRVFGKVVEKWSWAKDDPRWEEWKKKKAARDEAKKAQQEIEKRRTYKKPSKGDLKGFIYFIQGECGGPIKIGYTTDLEQRLKSLQTGYPDRLELLLAFPANPNYEKAIHKQFEEYRLNGEWFKPTPEVLKKIRYFGLLNAYVSADNNKDLMRMTYRG